MPQITNETNKGKQYAVLILNALCLIFFIWLAYRAFYDLFIFEPNVHYPKVQLSQTTWGKTVVQFTLNIGTTTSFIIFGAALVSIYASLMVFVVAFFGDGKPTRTYWRVQAICFLICFVATAIQLNDFMSTAFDGVG